MMVLLRCPKHFALQNGELLTVYDLQLRSDLYIKCSRAKSKSWNKHETKLVPAISWLPVSVSRTVCGIRCLPDPFRKSSTLSGIAHPLNIVIGHAEGRLDCCLQKCAAVSTTTALSPCQRRWMSGQWASRSLSCGREPAHGTSSGTPTADDAQTSRDPARSKKRLTGFQRTSRERLPSSVVPYLALGRTSAGTRCRHSMS